MAHTVPQAKNFMGKTVEEIIDPPPSKSDKTGIRKYFDNKCAYCGAVIEPRKGHLDHAVPMDGNHIGNLVLACATCNGDQKRETDWLTFLKTKASGQVLLQRKDQIKKWMKQHPSPKRPALSQQSKTVKQKLDKLIETFGRECGTLRKSLKGRHG